MITVCIYRDEALIDLSEGSRPRSASITDLRGNPLSGVNEQWRGSVSSLIDMPLPENFPEYGNIGPHVPGVYYISQYHSGLVTGA